MTGQQWIIGIVGGLIALALVTAVFNAVARRRTKREPERHDIYPMW